MHTHARARAHEQITLISVDSYAQHVYKCTVLIVLTFTTLQTRSFRAAIQNCPGALTQHGTETAVHGENKRLLKSRVDQN